MAVAEICKLEVGEVKQAVETGEASVKSATADAGAVCGVEVNMIDFEQGTI